MHLPIYIYDNKSNKNPSSSSFPTILYLYLLMNRCLKMVSKGSNNTSSYSSYARLLGSEMDNRGPTLHFTNINDIQAAVNNFVNKDQNLDTWITVMYLLIYTSQCIPLNV